MIGLAIDPGMENGACLFTFDDMQPFAVERLWQFPHGAPGLAGWLEMESIKATKEGVSVAGVLIDALIVEKFTPRPNENFNLTLDSVEPLRGEGVLIGRGFNRFIQWAQPTQQYFMGDSRLPLDEKKKLSRKFLETHGLKPTGKTVGRPNADDAISATLHSIAWLRRQKHRATIRALFATEGMDQ